MKKLLLILVCLISLTSFAQINPDTSNISDEELKQDLNMYLHEVDKSLDLQFGAGICAGLGTIMWIISRESTKDTKVWDGVAWTFMGGAVVLQLGSAEKRFNAGRRFNSKHPRAFN